MGGEKREVAILMSEPAGILRLFQSALTPEKDIARPEPVFFSHDRHYSGHHGIIVDFLGDAMLVFFDPFDAPVRPAVQEAVNCALEMQKTMSSER